MRTVISMKIINSNDWAPRNTIWTPYYSTCDINPIRAQTFTLNDLCPENNIYNVYLANCDLSPLLLGPSSQVPVGTRAVKVIDKSQTKICAPLINPASLLYEYSDIFAGENELICIIEDTTGLGFARPCYVTNYFYTLFPSLYILNGNNQDNTPLTIRTSWSGGFDYLKFSPPPFLTSLVPSISYIDYTTILPPVPSPGTPYVLNPIGSPLSWSNIRILLVPVNNSI